MVKTSIAMHSPPSVESTITASGVTYQLRAVMLLKKPNGQLQVAVDHSHLRSLASEKVSIDWPLPPPLQSSTP